MVANLLFCTCSFYLQMICLELCNGFSKSCLYFQRIKTRSLLYRRRIIEQAVDCLDYVFV